jgi:hypothetical protein
MHSPVCRSLMRRPANEIKGLVVGSWARCPQEGSVVAAPCLASHPDSGPHLRRPSGWHTHTRVHHTSHSPSVHTPPPPSRPRPSGNLTQRASHRVIFLKTPESRGACTAALESCHPAFLMILAVHQSDPVRPRIRRHKLTAAARPVTASRSP